MPFSCAASSASVICRVRRSASTIEQFCCAHSLAERLALDEFENQEPSTLDFLQSINTANIRVIECGQHPCFALEPRETIRTTGERRRQNLDRDIAGERHVARPIYFAHSACTYELQQVILAD